MARIAGVDLPKNKRIIRALTYIYGIGVHKSSLILENAKVDPSRRTQELSEEEVGRIRLLIEKEETVEGDLRRQNGLSIKRLVDLGCFRGLRHRRGLPVRGQRTKTNARTRKGPKKAALAGKKVAGKK